MNIRKNRGFTLIELLVVIAIIGILSSVVLASLNSARDKGRDASIKSSLQTVRVQSEIFYDDQTPPGYGSLAAANTAANCTAAGTLFADDPTIAAALVQVGLHAIGTVPIMCSHGAPTNGQAQEWAIETQLRDATGWCVDFTGQAITTAYDGVAANTTIADRSCG